MSIIDLDLFTEIKEFICKEIHNDPILFLELESTFCTLLPAIMQNILSYLATSYLNITKITGANDRIYIYIIYIYIYIICTNNYLRSQSITHTYYIKSFDLYLQPTLSIIIST